MASPEKEKELNGREAAAIARLASAGSVHPAPAWAEQALARLAKVAKLHPSQHAKLVPFASTWVNAHSVHAGTVLVSVAAWEEGTPLSRDEAVAIMAHELAHVELGHTLRSACQAVAVAGDPHMTLTEAAPALVKKMLSDPQLASAQAKARREQEFEADKRATQLLAAAGYPPSAVKTMLAKLSLQPQGKAPTHPELGPRIKRLQALGL